MSVGMCLRKCMSELRDHVYICVYMYVYINPLSCHVHSVETLRVQSSWRASQKARYLLLVTLLDVIIVCPRQLRHERSVERSEFKENLHKSIFLFLAFSHRIANFYVVTEHKKNVLVQQSSATATLLRMAIIFY